MKRRRAGESADGLVLMTSSMTSSYSADGLKEQSQESAALMSSQSAGSDQQMKRSERDEATSCWRISRWFSVDDVIDDVIIFSRWFERAVARISSSAKHPGANNRRSSKAQQLKNVSAAKQLTIYKSWMSTAERNSNGESDKTQSRSRWKEPMAEIKSCKLPQFKGTRFVLFWETVQFTEERCTSVFGALLVSFLDVQEQELLQLQCISSAQNHLTRFKCAAADLLILVFSDQQVVSEQVVLERALILKHMCYVFKFPSKHDDVKLVYVVSHTVAAGVHLWSLGVLTAAGCGIGSVHEL
ncbi:hypothetical protein F511_23357 [Dorcoceras hygrometricum]|uniref:Uncharacterized protein n=1 Tax=Dorcoceras hygrometricum TaxID=472368 RepID=A0A2Z7CHC0_9LAMI|nr:hypothetical protein F511_23357 [Dorcoceras hygrometricum]